METGYQDNQENSGEARGRGTRSEGKGVEKAEEAEEAGPKGVSKSELLEQETGVPPEAGAKSGHHRKELCRRNAAVALRAYLVKNLAGLLARLSELKSIAPLEPFWEQEMLDLEDAVGRLYEADKERLRKCMQERQALRQH